MERFAEWEVKLAGLFTFAHSPGHTHLYEKYGFWARFLTAVMSKPVVEATPASQWSRLSALPESARAESLKACRELTEAIYEGLNLEGEKTKERVGRSSGPF